MPISPAVRRYYERCIFLESGRDRLPRNFRPLEAPATGRSRVEGCAGGGKNLLEWTLLGDGGRIRDLRASCGLCNPAMYVAADIVCEWARGRSLAEVMAVDPFDLGQLSPLYAILSGPGRPDDAREKFQYALLALQNAVRDHRGEPAVPVPRVDPPTGRDHDDPE